MLKGEKWTDKLAFLHCEKGLSVSSVLGEEAAEVSFTFDLTRLNNDFVRLCLDH